MDGFWLVSILAETALAEVRESRIIHTMNVNDRNSFVPLWGGMPSLLGSAWSLYTTTQRGYSPIGWMFPSFTLQGGRAPVRQRVITGPIGTNGQAYLDIVANDDDDLGNFDDDGENVRTEVPPAPAAPPPATTWEFGFSPFRLVLRAVPLPIIGLVDAFVQGAKPVVYTVVSLVYQSLPLSSITRLSRFTRILKKTENFRYSPPPRVNALVAYGCGICGHSTFPVHRSQLSTTYATIRCRCEHQIIPKDSTIWGPLSELRPEAPYEYDIDDPTFSATPLKLEHRITKDLTKWIGVMLGIPGLKRCKHPILDHTSIKPQAFVPEPTVDTLYRLPPERIWRKENSCNGIRCVFCYPDSLHSWNPLVIQALRKFDIEKRLSSLGNIPMDDWVNLSKLWTQFLAIMKHAHANLDESVTYILSAVSASRVGSYTLLDSSRPNIVIVDTNETFAKLVKRYPELLGPGHFCYIVPILGNEFSIGSMRLVIAMIIPQHIKLLVVNQQQKYYEALCTTILDKLEIPWSSASIGHVYPFYMGAAYIVSGYSHLTAFEVCYLYYTLGYCYGFDEIIPAIFERTTCVLIADTGLPVIMAPIVTDKLPKYTRTLFKIVDSSGSHVASYLTDFSRENIFYMKALGRNYIDEGKVSFAHAIADPRPISTVTVTPDILITTYDTIEPSNARFSPSSAPGENILAEISHTHGGLIIFTFGSRGDRNPVLANARYAASLGVKVTVIHLNTEAEGRILANMEGELDQEKIRLFVRAREYIVGYVGKVIWVPYQLYQVGSISYTLAPPDDIIHPFISSNNVLIAFASALIGLVHAPDIRIGAFASAGCLPTSTDGVTFMKAVLNRSKERTEAAYWGGDGIAPPGYEHIPVLPPGDHAAMMPDYDTIYTKGTVGAVALAALSGCKVVVIGHGLDREYRNPYDAGAGFIAGQDPDGIFLALAKSQPAYLGVWLRSHFYNIKAIWAWYGPENIGLTLFRAMMFYLYLNRVSKITFLSTMPVTTLILMLDGRSTIPLRTLLVYTLAAKVFDTMLWTLSKNYIWVVSKFVSYNAKLMSSILAFWVAQRSGWAYGLMTVFLLDQFKPSLAWFLSWVLILFGHSPDKPNDKGDEYAVVEYVFVWHYIPVVHVALVCPFAGVRIEGRTNSFGLYTITERPGCFHSPFVFPTRLRLSQLRASMSTQPALPYGPTWNCYTVIWRLAGRHTARLGVSAIPFWIVNCASSVLAVLSAGSLAIVYTVMTTIPAIGGLSTRNSGLAAMIASACRQVVELVEENSGDYAYVFNAWFSRLTFLMPFAPRNPKL